MSVRQAVVQIEPYLHYLCVNSEGEEQCAPEC
jgi:hypothetical protein